MARMAHSRTTVRPPTTPAPARRKVVAEKTGVAAGARRSDDVDKTRPCSRLLIVHPDIDPKDITSALGVEPAHCSRKGAPRVTPKGTPLQGVYPDTRWTLSFKNPAGQKIEAVVAAIVDRLPIEGSFWPELEKAGGHASLILSVVGTKYQGASIGVDTIRKLARMGIHLGLEIYAVPQNG